MSAVEHICALDMVICIVFKTVFKNYLPAFKNQEPLLKFQTFAISGKIGKILRCRGHIPACHCVAVCYGDVEGLPPLEEARTLVPSSPHH